VSFLGEIVTTSRDGLFEFRYEPRDSLAVVSSTHPDYLDGSLSVQLHGHDTSEKDILLKQKPSAEVDSLHALVQRINSFADNGATHEKTEMERLFEDYFFEIQMGSTALPIAILIIWLISRWHRRKMLLERRTASGTPQIESVVVRGIADYLFRNTRFRRMVQQYRQHREVASIDLNVPATIEATLRNGGLFTPIFASRYVLPEYVILIDRASFGDQHAHFLDELVKRMTNDGVIIDRYYFDRDPRLLRPAKKGKRQVTVQELFIRHPWHRLLIFTDAAGFINAKTGKPHSWLDNFLEWSSRAIFIPEKTQGVEYLELSLKNMGFNIGPTSTQGLVNHIEAQPQPVWHVPPPEPG